MGAQESGWYRGAFVRGGSLKPCKRLLHTSCAHSSSNIYLVDQVYHIIAAAVAFIIDFASATYSVSIGTKESSICPESQPIGGKRLTLKYVWNAQLVNIMNKVLEQHPLRREHVTYPGSSVTRFLVPTRLPFWSS